MVVEVRGEGGCSSPGGISLANSTFFANVANDGGSGGSGSGPGGGGGDSAGGAIFVSKGDVDFVGLTIASNQAKTEAREAPECQDSIRDARFESGWGNPQLRSHKSG